MRMRSPCAWRMAAQQARRMGRGAAMLAAGRAPLGRLAGSVTAWVAGPHPLWEGEAPGRRIDRFKQGKYALRRARRPSPVPHLDGVATAVHARANLGQMCALIVQGKGVWCFATM